MPVNAVTVFVAIGRNAVPILIAAPWNASPNTR
jgi:hypothetical protein